MKYLAAMAVVLNLGIMGDCQAFTADEYTDMLREGKYHVEYVLTEDNGFKVSNDCIFIRDTDEKIFYQRNLYYPTSDYPYYCQKVLQDGVERYYAEKISKKNAIDPQTAKLKKNHQNSSAGIEKYTAVHDDAVKGVGEFFSMLGKISENAGVLPNYKVNLLNRGQEELDGNRYDVEEYEIVVPYRAKLKMYYLNGEPVKSIKTMDDAWVGHSMYSDIKIKRKGYVAVDIKRFDNRVTAEDFVVKTKK